MVDLLKKVFPLQAQDEAEKRRRAAVLAELAQGRPSLVRTDLRGAPAEDRALVGQLLKPAEIIERLYAKQVGSAGMEAAIPAADTTSRALFHRNRGPWCEAPLAFVRSHP